MQRPAYLAGRWYPDDPAECREALRSHERDAAPEPGDYRGLIGPHAGWAFSGDCAGRTYPWLADARADADLVVVFGAHRGARGPNSIFLAEAWETPIGAMRNARELAHAIAKELDLEEEPARPARPDNATELHLPFVRAAFPNAELLALGIAAAPIALSIGRKVGEAVRGRDAVFIGSTDLTHYGPNYDFAPKGYGDAAVKWAREVNDAGFLRALLEDRPGDALTHAIEHHSACCPGCAVAALAAARGYGHTPHPRLVDHYLSYDVRPDESFVGYAGLVL